MMEPRLELLWDFLSVSGSIWISIDDEECHYLKVLCDKIWGRDKFVTMIVRQKNDSPRNYKRRKIVHMQDYVLIYAKNPAQCLLREVSVNYLERYFVHDSILLHQYIFSGRDIHLLAPQTTIDLYDIDFQIHLA